MSIDGLMNDVIADGYRTQFEENYDDLDYLIKLADEVAKYNAEHHSPSNYKLLDDIDERIKELEEE